MKSIVDKLVSRIDAIEQNGSTSGGNESGSTTNIETTKEITDVEGTSEKIPTEGAVVKYVKANSGSSTSGEIYQETGEFKFNCTIPSYIPLCLKSTSFFECTVRFEFIGTAFSTHIIEVMHAGNHNIYKISRIKNKNQGPKDVEFSLAAVQNTDGQEIICLKLSGSGWNVGETNYYISSHQEILSNIELKTDTASDTGFLYQDPILQQLEQRIEALEGAGA